MVIISPLVFWIRSSRYQITAAASSGQARWCWVQIIRFHQNKNTGSLITRTISNYKYAGSDLTLRKFIKSIKFVTHFTIKFNLSQKNLSQFLRMTFGASTGLGCYLAFSLIILGQPLIPKCCKSSCGLNCIMVLIRFFYRRWTLKC